MQTFLAQAAAEPALLDPSVQYLDLTLLYLGAAVLIYAILLLGGRLLKRRYGLPLGWAYHFFCIAVAAFVPTRFPGIDLGPSESKFFLPVVVITGLLVVLRFIRHYFYERFLTESNAQVPKFLSQFISIAVTVAAILVLLDSVYEVQVTGLLAGAGIVGIVLGLALQDTLGNIFSGFAIYFGGQFKAGDWLLVDGHHAKVVEINWRSTRLRTFDEVCLDIPNSNITKQTVVNYDYPTSLHAMRIDIGLDYNSPPTLVQTVLCEAALDCPLVLRDPAPSVFLTAFGDWSVTYQLRYWLADHGDYNTSNSHIRTVLWYSLKRHGINIPFPIQHEISLPAPEPVAEDRQRIRDSLGKTVFASCLSAQQIEELSEAVNIVCFGKSESVIRQGAPAGPMYVLVTGRAQVWIESGGVRTPVSILEPGACIGENSVLTGDSRSATILALEDLLAVRIDKSTIAPFLNHHPELLERLSELLAARKLQNEGAMACASDVALKVRKQDYRDGILSKLKTMFEV